MGDQPVTPPVPQPVEHSDERELQLIVARVRMLMDREREWRATRDDTFLDPWQARDLRRDWVTSDETGRALQAALQRIDESARGRLSLLARLESTFDLEPRESFALQICLAFAIAPDLAHAIPTEPLIARLIGDIGRRFTTPQSPLMRWSLLHLIDLGPGDPPGLAIDPALHDWFTRTYVIDPALIDTCSNVASVAPLERWPVAEVVARIRRHWERTDLDGHLRITISAPHGAGRRSFAAAVARELGLDILAIDADRIDDTAWHGLVRRAHRHAFLTRSALAFHGDSLARRSPELAGGFPLIFACVEPGHEPPAGTSTIEISLTLPLPTIADREAMWRQACPTTTWPEGAITELATRDRTLPADIAFAGRCGVSTADEAAAAVRDRSRGRLGELAHRVDCPFIWSDLVLPRSALEILHDYEFEARERATVWELPGLRRMFPQGRGLFALFTGSPGTGKTMAAQVIAASLGADLFRVSLAEVVNKYIGETAKNLDKILARAERTDSVLLFDEADALFGKRTEIKDAHDRYANMDTNHLLQAFEAYAGIAILATNRRANIDHAFLRRLRYVVEFPQPDVAERLELWRRVTRELCGEATVARLATTLPGFATAVEMTGAQIKFAVLAALFAARRDRGDVVPRHLVDGIERELNKEGRSLAERDRERLASDVR